jgi:hypothetical protein
MDDETLNRLAAEIEDVGMIDPIQVVKVEPDKDGKEYMILGGEHRWRASSYVGRESIPAVVLTDDKWQDEDTQKFVTMRLNALKGDLNPHKFALLYKDLAKRYSHGDMQRLMAFSDDARYKELTKGLVDKVKGSNLPDFVKDEFVKKVKEKKHTVDGLSKILNRLFKEYGSTLQNHYMFFEYGGKKHLKVQVDKHLWGKLEGVMELVSRHGVSAAEVFKDMIRGYDADRIEMMPKVEARSDGEEG